MKTLLLLLTFALLPLVLHAAKTAPQVVVSSDRIAKVPVQLDRNSTLRYALYVEPYREIGAVVSKSTKPDSSIVVRAVTAALPAEKFAAVTAPNAQPDVVIACHWGEVSAQGPQRKLTAREGGAISAMRAILVGRTAVPPFMGSHDQESLKFEGDLDRYFLVVSAYDVAALREGKISILWQTRASSDSLRSSSSEIWSQLANTSANYFGKELDHPVFVSVAPVTTGDAAGASVAVEQFIPNAPELLSFESHPAR